ncbi:sensor histidine kinase, partial [Candidatus Neomarinimicrobiota bacterium]
TLEDQVENKSKELEEAQRQILAVERITSLGRLATTAAHELNNPLASILNYSKLILRDIRHLTIPAEARERIIKDLDFIRDESQRCGKIVTNLLLFAGRAEGTFEEVNGQEIIDKSLMLVAHKMEMQNIELKLHIDTSIRAITCDPAQIQQALVALLINALEAMPDGGVLTVQLAASDKSGDITMRIQDTGPGIPRSIRDHIFEPFYTTKSGGKSVGMGLAVVYGIIQRHGGTIEVESEENKGTSFIIQIPHSQKQPAEAVENHIHV